MSIQNTTLNPGQAANIFVGTGNTGAATTTMYFCNRDTAPRIFNLYAVPAGFIANSNNIIYSSKLIASNDTYIMDTERLFLGPYDQLQANANVGNAIVVTISSIGI
jgi:hypothetical protein